MKKIPTFFLITFMVITSAPLLIQAANQPRHAPNMYVDWPRNGDYDVMTVDWYCEQDARNTYWAVHNWDGGYAGFQNVNGEHKLLMSLWDLEDGTKPVIEYVMDGKNGDFGGEGTGKQVFTDYNWQAGKWYSMRVQVWTENGKSYYGQWVREGNGQWIKTAVISYSKPNRKFSGSSMFQEDFVGNTSSRKCRLKNAYGRFYGTNNWDSWNNYSISNTYFPTDPPTWDDVQWNITFASDWGMASDSSYVWLQSGGSDFTSNGKNIPITYSVNQAAAPFSPNVADAATYNIKTAATAGGFATSGGIFVHGAQVKLTATPNTGYAFAGWYENNVNVSKKAVYTFAATASRTLEARFVTAFNADANSITINDGVTSKPFNPATYEFKHGVTYTLSFTTENGAKHWTAEYKADKNDKDEMVLLNAKVKEIKTELDLFAEEVLRLTNIERANNGLPALSGANTLLNQAATVRIQEIITVLPPDLRPGPNDPDPHDRPDGRDPITAYTDLGGTYANWGENIAAGQLTPAAAVQSWMNSTGHRNNMLNPNYTHLGVGVAYNSNGRLCWVQLFIRGR